MDAGKFFTWAAAQEGRYEFDGFAPAIIIRSLHRALDRRLRGSGCQPLGPDAGVATVDAAMRHPDALVTCASLDGEALTVPGVVVVFEVLSFNTSRTDRIIKVREYAAVASIRRYVILESTSVGLMVLERQGPNETWRAAALTGADVLHMPEIGIEIPVPELYEDVGFSDQAATGA